MNLEELTTHQIILLTLLVSFVTSIATGIVTVSLMDQAPPGMTNTINRVVERTVERVVPDTNGQAASVITKETTVVVKEEDLITSSIDKGVKSLVRIDVVGSTPEEKTRMVALGVFLSSNGLVVTDASKISEDGVYMVRYGDARYETEIVAINEEKNIAILKVTQQDPDAKPLKFPVISFADMSALKLGQTLIGLSGDTKNLVSMGVISAIEKISVPVDKESTSTEVKEDSTEKVIEQKQVISRIDSNIKDIVTTGAPVMNVFGDMVGIMLVAGQDRRILPSSDIVLLVQSIKTTEKTTSQ